MEALMIGVSGMRGTVGGTLTPAVVMRMASALAVHLNRTAKPKDGKAFKVVFGRDGRPSGTFVRDAAISALVAHGFAVVDLDIVTTPSVAYMIKAMNADAGVIATASHNPINWNGLKFLRGDAVAPPPEDAAAIKKIFDANGGQGETELVRVEKLVPLEKNGETHGLHVSKVLELVDVLGISSKRFKVVLDSVCGAGSVPGAMLLGRLGCQTIHLHGTPTGIFPHTPEPLAENLTELAGEVKRQKAHVGFAQDPDADRLAIIDENGVFIGEEYTLALCTRAVLKKGGVVGANLSTSRMVDDIAAKVGGRVVRTPVGEANVIQGMMREGALIGGEGNGGVIDPRVVPGRDSLVSMGHVLNLMASTGKTVNQLVAEIPRYEILKTKFECRREDADKAVAAVKKAFAHEKVDTQDGVRIDWAESWVHARASNTEPIMRIIAEAPTKAEAQQRVAAVQAVVDAALK